MIDAAAAGREQIGERGEEALELIELGVDRDAQRLERARRGVDLRLALLDDRDALRDARAARSVVVCDAGPRASPP